MYMLLMLVSAVLALLMRFYGDDMVADFYVFKAGCTTDRCFGIQAVYRWSFALASFFLSMALITVVWARGHMGAWLLKLILFGALVTASFFVPNTFFDGYADFARVGSVIFMVMQLVLLVDFAYWLHEWLLQSMDKRESDIEARGYTPGACSNPWKLVYLALATVLLVTNITAAAVLYHFYGDCSINQFFISFALVIGICITVLSLFNAIGKGLIPPMVVWGYCTFLSWGAISNNPSEECGSGTEDNNGLILFGLLLAAISVAWAGYQTASAVQSAARGAPKGTKAPKPDEDVEEEEGDRADGYISPGPERATGAAKDDVAVPMDAPARENDPRRDADGAVKDARPERRIWVFHAVMFLAGLYMAMLLSNWGTADNGSGAPEANPERSKMGMWGRFVSEIFVYLLFTWTMIAPAVCPNRDFS
jgi:hypothetical protein